MSELANRVLIVTNNGSISDRLSEALAQDQSLAVSSSGSTLAEMNGSAQQLAFKHDVVLFEAHPDDQDEIGALKALTNHVGQNTAFLAVSDVDLPLSTTRMLRNLGVEDVLPVSITPQELSESVHNSLRNHMPVESPESTDGTVIAVGKARGGVGGTTVAVNLAYTLLGRHGFLKKTAARKVVLLDLDIQFGNAAVFLDLPQNSSIIDLVQEDELPDKPMIQTSVTHHASGVDVISAPLMLVPVSFLDGARVANLISALKRDYDFVVIDMPYALLDWVDSVLESADLLLMTTDLSVPSIRNARRLIDFYTADHLNLLIEVLVNHEKKPLIQHKRHKDAKAALDCPLSHWLPHDANRAEAAVDDGIPVVAAAPGAEFSKAMSKIAARIIQTKMARKAVVH